MNKKSIIITIILILVIVISAYMIISNNPTIQKNNDCNKEDNCCLKNEDCKYFSLFDSCHTEEYNTKIGKGCINGTGPCPERAPERENIDNITCSCETHKCITKY